MSHVYDELGNIKDNCFYVIQPSKPINIRGQRSDANWSVECLSAKNTNTNVSCVFWTKKQALQFLQDGVYFCEYTNEKLYEVTA
jgi:hypothetical protein